MVEIRLKHFSQIEFLDELCSRFPKNFLNVRSNLEMFHYEEYLQVLYDRLPLNARVLEVGCGNGLISYLLSNYVRPDIELIATEKFSKEVPDTHNNFIVKQLKLKGFNITIMDSLNLNFEDKCFDTVISFGVMEHVDNDEQFLREANRVLFDGGQLFIFNLPNKYAFNDFVARKFFNGGHKIRYDVSTIKRLLMGHGFNGRKTIIRKEQLIPTQIGRISAFWNKFFNKHYIGIAKLDKFLLRTPLKFFAQTYNVISFKNK